MLRTFTDITDVTAFKSLSVGGITVPIWVITVRLSSLTQFFRSHVYDITDQPRYDELGKWNWKPCYTLMARIHHQSFSQQPFCHSIISTISVLELPGERLWSLVKYSKWHGGVKGTNRNDFEVRIHLLEIVCEAHSFVLRSCEISLPEDYINAYM